jgi:hypothetical protein
LTVKTELDNQDGEFFQDFDAAQEYCRQTMQYIKHSLDLERVPEQELTNNPIIRSFGEVAAGLKGSPEGS